MERLIAFILLGVICNALGDPLYLVRISKINNDSSHLLECEMASKFDKYETQANRLCTWNVLDTSDERVLDKLDPSNGHNQTQNTCKLWVDEEEASKHISQSCVRYQCCISVDLQNGSNYSSTGYMDYIFEGSTWHPSPIDVMVGFAAGLCLASIIATIVFCSKRFRHQTATTSNRRDEDINNIQTTRNEQGHPGPKYDYIAVGSTLARSFQNNSPKLRLYSSVQFRKKQGPSINLEDVFHNDKNHVDYENTRDLFPTGRDSLFENQPLSDPEEQWNRDCDTGMLSHMDSVISLGDTSDIFANDQQVGQFFGKNKRRSLSVGCLNEGLGFLIDSDDFQCLENGIYKSESALAANQLTGSRHDISMPLTGFAQRSFMRRNTSKSNVRKQVKSRSYKCNKVDGHRIPAVDVLKDYSEVRDKI